MSARIYYFPRSSRPHWRPAVRYAAIRRRSSFRSGGFALLWAATLLAEFLYLFGIGGIERHDGFYAALLVAVWCVYFLHDYLIRTRLRPVLLLAGWLLPLMAAVTFFGFVYWLIWTHS